MEKIKNLIKTALEIGFVPEKEIEKIKEEKKINNHEGIIIQSKRRRN